MKTILFAALQVIVASGILYGYYHFFLRNKQFHQYNRYYLLAATVISILIPFFNIPVYFTEEETQSSAILQTLKTIYYSGTEEAVMITTASSGGSFDWNMFLYSLYALIALVLFTRIVISLKNIARIIKTNKGEKLGDIQFINTSEPDAPYSFFRWLFWNKGIELNSDKGQQIFRHEVFHIRQRHSWDVIFIEIANMIFWINPFFYLIKKELRAIHEFLADQFAVNEDEKWNYAELLLMQALQTNQRFVNPFFHNQIKRRIAMITNSQKTSYRYLRKILALPVGVMITLALAFTYKSNHADKPIEGSAIKENLIAINSNPVDSPPPKTTEIKLVKVAPSSDNTSTKETADGQKPVIQEVVVQEIPGTGDIVIKGRRLVDSPNAPLIVIDDVIQEGTDLKHIDANAIESMTVLKGETAVALYGSKAANGAILITTRKTAEMILRLAPADSSEKLKEVVVVGYAKSADKVFESVEKEASFPGGQKEWNKFLERNVNANIPIENKAPAGVYPVIVQFIVRADGSIDDIKALTNQKYGMEEEAIRIIKLSSKWEPAMQNGRPVTSYRRQPITFQVVNDEKSPESKKGNILDEVVVEGYGTLYSKPKKEQPYSQQKAIELKKYQSKNGLQRVISTWTPPTIYPNPTSNSVTVSIDSKLAGKGEARITDITGSVRKVVTVNFVTGKNNFTVDVSDLTNGTYFVQLVNADKAVGLYKMIKQ
jgi:TonB-dependent SusC/RagA subfamily outer membrane receptor